MRSNTVAATRAAAAPADYDPATLQTDGWCEMVFTDQQEVPPSRSNHTAVIFSEKMIIFGGCDLENNKLSDTWIYSLDTEKWEQAKFLDTENNSSSPPSGRSHHSCCVHADMAYFFGGEIIDKNNEKLVTNDLFVLELNDMNWVTMGTKNLKPPARDRHCACCLDNYLIIYGGVGQNGEALFDLTRFDLTNEDWVKGQVLRVVKPELARYSHSCVACGSNLMLIFGGYDMNGLKCNDVISYSTKVNVIEKIETSGIPPSPRTGHSQSIHGNVIVIFGGSLRLACADTNDLYYLSVGKWAWRTKQSESDAYAMLGNVENLNNEEFNNVATSKDAKRYNSMGKMSEGGYAFLNEILGHSSRGTAGLRLAGGQTDRIEGKVPCARDGHTTIVHDGLLYLYGGDKCGRKLSDLFIYKL